MLRFFLGSLSAVLFVIAPAVGQTSAQTTSTTANPPTNQQMTYTSGEAETSAQARVESALNFVKSMPNRIDLQIELAEALLARERETGDTALLDRADKAVADALQLDPNSYAAKRTEVRLLLSRDRFVEAKALAEALNKLAPDDLEVYSEIAQAAMATGDYRDAEVAAQFMMDLRPNDPAGLLRAAQVRGWIGDPEGALEFLETVEGKSDPNDRCERASLLAQIAHMQLLMGRADAAQASARLALESFPTSVDAMAGLAEALTALGDDAAAADALAQRVDISPTAANLYDLAIADQRIGKGPEAATLLARFEKLARQQIDMPANADRQLVEYCINTTHDLAEAVRISKIELARRHDVATVAEYAWALYAQGDVAGAWSQMRIALNPGYRDATLAYRAAIIAHDAGQTKAAARYWKQAIEFGPSLGITPTQWAELLHSTR